MIRKKKELHYFDIFHKVYTVHRFHEIVRSMIKYSKYILFISAIVSALIIYPKSFFSKEPEFVEPKFPLATFSDEKLTNLQKEVLTPQQKYKVYACKKVVFDGTNIAPIKHIFRYLKAYKIRENPDLWCSLDLIRLPSNNDFSDTTTEWRLYIINPFDFNFLPLFFLFIALSLIFFSKLLWIPINHEKKYLIYSSLGYVSLQISGICFLFFICGFFTLYSFDPDFFFNLSTELIDFSRKSPIPVGVGMPLLYAPFIVLFNAKEYADISVPFTIFNYVVCGIGLLVVLLIIVKQLTDNKIAIHCTALTACLYPLFAWIFWQGSSENPAVFSKNILYLAKEHPLSIALLNKGLLLSWNGLSDNTATFFMGLALCLGICLKKSFLKYFFCGVAIGIAMIFRYPSFLILPAFVFWEFTTWSQEKTNFSIKRFVYYTFIFFIGFILIFSIQLLDNYLVNGNFFKPSVDISLYRGKSPYIYNLFSIENLKHGLRFYLKINYKIFFIAICFLFCLKRSDLGIFFWLWIVCPLVFYASFNGYSVSAIRYLIPVFFAIYCIIGIGLSELSFSKSFLIVVFIILNYVLTSPESPKGWNIINVPEMFSVLIPCFSALIFISIALILTKNRFFWLVISGLFLLFSTGNYLVIIFGLIAYPFYAFAKYFYLKSIERNIIYK